MAPATQAVARILRTDFSIRPRHEPNSDEEPSDGDDARISAA